MKLSDKLKYLMLRNGISSTILANQTNIDQTTINRILNNFTQEPKTDTVYTLAKFFNVDINQLINNEPLEELILVEIRPSSLKEVLTILMKKNGNMSINALHKYTNISRTGISDILKEKTHNPNMDTLQKLADYFQVTIPQLCGIEPILSREASLVEPTTFSVPVISINRIFDWLNQQVEPEKYVKPTVKTLDNTAYAIKIETSAYLPDITKNQILIIDKISPQINNFAIYCINNQINVYEFIAQKNQSVVLRKAGDYDISVYQKNKVQLLGTVIQQLIE